MSSSLSQMYCLWHILLLRLASHLKHLLKHIYDVKVQTVPVSIINTYRLSKWNIDLLLSLQTRNGGRASSSRKRERGGSGNGKRSAVLDFHWCDKECRDTPHPKTQWRFWTETTSHLSNIFICHISVQYMKYRFKEYLNILIDILSC